MINEKKLKKFMEDSIEQVCNHEAGYEEYERGYKIAMKDIFRFIKEEDVCISKKGKGGK